MLGCPAPAAVPRRCSRPKHPYLDRPRPPLCLSNGVHPRPPFGAAHYLLTDPRGKRVAELLRLLRGSAHETINVRRPSNSRVGALAFEGRRIGFEGTLASQSAPLSEGGRFPKRAILFGETAGVTPAVQWHATPSRVYGEADRSVVIVE